MPLSRDGLAAYGDHDRHYFGMYHIHDKCDRRTYLYVHKLSVSQITLTIILEEVKNINKWRQYIISTSTCDFPPCPLGVTKRFLFVPPCSMRKLWKSESCWVQYIHI